MITRRAIDGCKRSDVAVGKSLERLKAGAGKACTRRVAVGQTQEIADRVAITGPVNRVAVEGHGADQLGDRRPVGIRHEAHGIHRAILPRQIIRMLATAGADAEAVVSRGDMDEDGFGGAAEHILERGSIHKQLPVVFVRGKVKRYFVGRDRSGGVRRDWR